MSGGSVRESGNRKNGSKTSGRGPLLWSLLGAGIAVRSPMGGQPHLVPGEGKGSQTSFARCAYLVASASEEGH